MPSLSPLDAAVSSSATVGRYFAAVSVVPAALFVLYLTLLLSAGAWSGPMDPSRIGGALEAFGWQDFAWFVAAALVIALAIHPLQFALTQALEGYWGTSTLALMLTARAVSRHHRKAVWLKQESGVASRGWIMRGAELWDPERYPSGNKIGGQELQRRQTVARRALALPTGAELLPRYLAHQAYEKKLRSYPEELHRIMPTRLGNVLRQSEDRAGKQYGLDTLVIAPHLSLLAKAEHYAYVQDRQKAMDLAIAMCLVGALATMTSAVLLSDDGPWCLLSLLPFAVSYASYLGAVAAARSYNVAVETVTDLSRFALYDALRVAQPKTGEEEQETAEALMALLRGARKPKMQWVHPEPSSAIATISFGPGGAVMPSSDFPVRDEHRPLGSSGDRLHMHAAPLKGEAGQ